MKHREHPFPVATGKGVAALFAGMGGESILKRAEFQNLLEILNHRRRPRVIWRVAVSSVSLAPEITPNCGLSARPFGSTRIGRYRQAILFPAARDRFGE
jgi:hypothetical protein